jgi:hypothetical protein
MNSGGSHWAVNDEGNGRWEGKSEKWWSAMSARVTSFMWVAGDDSFLEKKVTFCFNRSRNPDVDTRSQGVRSSKDFEIRGILEKEPRAAGRISYQANRHGCLPEVKIESSA